jgi:CheY-like chemotaxis protein
MALALSLTLALTLGKESATNQHPPMPTLLVVDDSEPVRKAVRDGLGAELQVIEAENGLKAIEVLETQSVDVVILDCVMPIMDGPSTLRVIRARGHRMPVILLTSETKASRIASMMALGAQQFVAKPMRVEELRRKVNDFIALRPADVIPAEETPTVRSMPPPAAYKRIAVLLVDGNERAVGRFWETIPGFVDPLSASDIPAALATCQQRRFRAVVLDPEALKTAPSGSIEQLRALAVGATLVGVFLRTTADKDEAARALGLECGLYKPFAPEEVQRLMESLAGLPATLEVRDNILGTRPFPHAAENQPAFAERLRLEVVAGIEASALASHDRVWLDIRHPIPAGVFAAVIAAASRQCDRLGLELGIVDSAGLLASLSAAASLGSLRVVSSIDEIE